MDNDVADSNASSETDSTEDGLTVECEDDKEEESITDTRRELLSGGGHGESVACACASKEAGETEPSGGAQC